MELSISADEEKLRVSHETWTNPYGVPNFEYDSDMNFDLRMYLEDEAETALQDGRLPPEPNIKEILATGKHLK